MGAPVDDERLLPALVAELMRKSSLCWLRLRGADRDHPVWHVWHDGAAYVLSGGSEQPCPGIESAETATVVVRSKESRERMLAWEATVRTLGPTDPEWDQIVAELLSARLNLADMATAPRRWAQECVVTRLTPTGAFAEPPGGLPDDDLAAPPPATPATTRHRLPRVLHRRQTRQPRLR